MTFPSNRTSFGPRGSHYAGPAPYAHPQTRAFHARVPSAIPQGPFDARAFRPLNTRAVEMQTGSASVVRPEAKRSHSATLQGREVSIERTSRGSSSSESPSPTLESIRRQELQIGAESRREAESKRSHSASLQKRGSHSSESPSPLSHGSSGSRTSSFSDMSLSPSPDSARESDADRACQHYLSQIKDAEKNENWPLVLENFKAALQIKPRDPGLWYCYARTAIELQEFVLFHSIIKEAQIQCPRSSEVRALREMWRVYEGNADANASREVGNYELAISLYRIATQLNPNKQMMWGRYVFCVEKVQGALRALEVLKEAIRSNPTVSMLYLRAMAIEDKRGNFEGVNALVNQYEKATAFTHKNFDVLFFAVNCEARLGDFHTALGRMKSLCAKYPELHLVWEFAANFERTCGNFEQAFQYAYSGFCLPKNSFRSFVLTVELAQTLGKSPEFIENLFKMEKAKYTPNNPEDLFRVWMFQAEYYMHHRRFSECMSHMDQALGVCPQTLKFEVLAEKARFATIANIHPQGALQFLGEAYDVAATKHKYKVALIKAKCQEYAGDIQGAIATYKEATGTFSNEWATWYSFACFYLRHKHVSQAKAILEEAVRLHPQVGRVQALLIQVKYQRGNEAEMMAYFEKALAEIPNGGEIWCEFGRFLKNPENPYYNLEKAEAALKKAIIFTSQYGDSYIELAHLKMMQGGSLVELSDIRRELFGRVPNYGLLWETSLRAPFEGNSETFTYAIELLKKNMADASTKDYISGMSAFGLNYVNFTRDSSSYRPLKVLLNDLAKKLN